MKMNFPYILSLGILVLIGVASWSIYNIVNAGSADLLLKYGIESFYLQNVIIIAVVFAILLLSGYGFKKSIEKLLR